MTKQQNNAPTLTLFCGLPGAGKTTLAKLLEEQGAGIRICTDDWESDLGMSHNPDNFHRKLREKLYSHALVLLKNGQSVILEDGLWTKKDRSEKLAAAVECGAHAVLHYFDLTFDETWARLNARNQDLPQGAVHIEKESLQSCWDKFERPTTDELAQFHQATVHTGASKHPAD